MQGSDQSPSRLLRGKTRRNGMVSKQDGIANGASHSGKHDSLSKMVPEHSTSQVKDAVMELFTPCYGDTFLPIYAGKIK